MRSPSVFEIDIAVIVTKRLNLLQNEIELEEIQLPEQGELGEVGEVFDRLERACLDMIDSIASARCRT